MTISCIGSACTAPLSNTRQSAEDAEANAFATLLAATRTPVPAATAENTDAATSAAGKTTLDTSSDRQAIDIDSYFTPKTGTAGASLSAFPPLLLPTANNIDTLSAHASTKLQQLLAANGIPSAPSEITYGPNGEMVLPDDYPYADQLKQALADDPVTDRELRTVNALASHYVGIQESVAFSEEYASASSQAAADAVVAKYSDLFSAYRRHADIALNFAADGSLSVTADGEPYRPRTTS